MARLFDDDPRWAQALARSAEAEGRFVYAVKSTGVFCRPTCPSRRPRREQVLFYDHSAEAERAGFRSCRRCRPDGARPVTEGAKAVARAAADLRTHADEPVELPDLASLTGLSPSHLQRAFTAHTGVSPRQFQAACRAQRFRASLRTAMTHDRHLRSGLRLAQPGVRPQAHRPRLDPRGLPPPR